MDVMGSPAHRPVTIGGADVHALLVRAARAQQLAACFRYPGAGSAAALAMALTRLHDAGRDDPEVGPRVSRLWAAIDPRDDSGLQAAYSRHFIGVGASPLHETAFGRPRLTTAAELADVRGFYRAFGFDLSEETPEAADHLGAELEFHAALLVKLAWAAQQGHAEGWEVTAAAAASFLESHLGRWVPALTGRILAGGADDFYALAAREAERFVRAECAWFGAAPDPVAAEDGRERADTFTCPHADHCG
jgi:TorA maturation chaperone TorD